MSIESTEIPNGIVQPIRGEQMEAQSSEDDLSSPHTASHIHAHCGMAIKSAFISQEQTSLVSLWLL
jgi:hypothetical protein